MAELIAAYPVGAFTDPQNGNSPIDADEVRANDDALRTGFNTHDADPTIHFQGSLLASRPAAGTAGRKWFASDTNQIFRDNGSSWAEIDYLNKTNGGTVAGATTFSGGLTSTAGSRTFGATTFTGTISGTTAIFSSSISAVGATLTGGLTGTSASFSSTLGVTGLGTFASGVVFGSTASQVGTPYSISRDATYGVAFCAGPGTTYDFVLFARNGLTGIMSNPANTLNMQFAGAIDAGIGTFSSATASARIVRVISSSSTNGAAFTLENSSGAAGFRNWAFATNYNAGGALEFQVGASLGANPVGGNTAIRFNSDLTIVVPGSINITGSSGFALGSLNMAGRRRIQSTGASGFNMLGDDNGFANLEIAGLTTNAPSTFNGTISATTATFANSGGPLVLNSTNSDPLKVTLKDAGSTVGYLGGNSSNAFLVGRASDGTQILTLSQAGTLTVNAYIGTQLSFAGLSGTAKVIGATTGIALRNNADSADNLLISDAGVVTSRSTLQSGASVIAAAASAHSWTGRSLITSPADGTLLITPNAGFGTTLIQLGGTTGGWAGLKSAGTSNIVQIRNADDTAFGSLQCNSITAVDYTGSGVIQTGAPSGGASAIWRLGSRVAATVALVTSQYIQVEIAGVAYKLATVS